MPEDRPKNNCTVEWFDHEGQRRKKGTRIADKDAAMQLANKLETEAEKRRQGMIDVTQERYAKHRRRSLQKHVDDFEDYLKDKQNTPKHVSMTCQHIRWVAEKCGAERLPDLTGGPAGDQCVARIGGIPANVQFLPAIGQELLPLAVDAKANTR